jgi:hypothetical protein
VNSIETCPAESKVYVYISDIGCQSIIFGVLQRFVKNSAIWAEMLNTSPFQELSKLCQAMSFRNILCLKRKLALVLRGVSNP